jgi:tetratricopeptide (TPR) repeat protein
VLQRVTGQPADALLEGLGEALAVRVLVEGDELGHYAFAHALTRQTLQDELRVPQRVALHRRIAETLEAVSADAGDAFASELAHHYFEAAPGGDVQKAVHWSVRAAERAHALFAYDEAVRHYERALEALELRLPVDEDQRCQLLLALAEERWAAGEREPSRAAFAQAADNARRRGDVRALARAAVGMRGYGEMGLAPDDATLALLREALVAVGEEHPASRSRLLSRLTGSAPYAQSMQTRRELSDEAHALALRSGDREALADAVAARFWATLGPDRVDERLAVAAEASALGREWGDPRLQILGEETLVGAHLLRGEIESAERAVGRYAALAEALRQPIFHFLAQLLRGSVALNRGRFAEAQARFDRAAEVGRGTVVYADIMHAGTVFWLHSMRGDVQPFGETESLLGEVFRDDEKSGRILLRAGIAFAQLLRGEERAARSELDAVLCEDLRALERDEHWLLAMGTLSDSVCCLGEREAAALLYELLQPHARLMVVHDLIRAVPGSVDSVLGSLAGAIGRVDEGCAHFEAAVAREQALGLRPALCASRVGLARLLRARGGPGESARAESLIEAAEADAREMGSRRRYRDILARP